MGNEEARRAGVPPHESIPALEDEAHQWRAPQPRPERASARGEYGELVETYLAALTDPLHEHYGRPVVAVAAKQWISKSAAAKRIARARSKGLLPPTTRGKASERPR